MHNNISYKNPIYINKQYIEEYLGKNVSHVQYVHQNDMVGVINGLYATDRGQGGIMPIQIYNNFDKNNKDFLKITGNQMKTMKESILSAYTTAIHQIDTHVRNEYVIKHPYGFHVHNPEGSVQKDGPSAGCAFAIAFVSRFLNKKIKHDVAITGEIDLTGKVSKIGGLQFKLIGAKRAGVKLILVPKENEADILTIKKKYNYIFDDDFNVILVDHLSDTFKYVFVEND